MEVKYEMRKIIRIESVIEMVGCVEADPEFWKTDLSSNLSREWEISTSPPFSTQCKYLCIAQTLSQRVRVLGKK
jgi:hypothetical protein